MKMHMHWNLHSHTYRCHHAGGTEEEMILAAVRAGMRTMGFADHAPMPCEDGFVSRIRMLPEELPEYMDTLRALRAKYAGEIEIPIGLEAEYFPAVFPEFLALARSAGVEFLLLGQHYVLQEHGSPYMGKETGDEALLRIYVDQICEAMDTGVFTYVAHPDLIHFTGSGRIFITEMRRLTRHAADRGIPLELNINGARDERHYPNPLFWKIAAEEGAAAVLGIDAHHPKHVNCGAAEAVCRRIAGEAGIQLLENMPVRHL